MPARSHLAGSRDERQSRLLVPKVCGKCTEDGRRSDVPRCCSRRAMSRHTPRLHLDTGMVAVLARPSMAYAAAQHRFWALVSAVRADGGIDHCGHAKNCAGPRRLVLVTLLSQWRQPSSLAMRSRTRLACTGRESSQWNMVPDMRTRSHVRIAPRQIEPPSRRSARGPSRDRAHCRRDGSHRSNTRHGHQQRR